MSIYKLLFSLCFLILTSCLWCVSAFSFTVQNYIIDHKEKKVSRNNDYEIEKTTIDYESVSEPFQNTWLIKDKNWVYYQNKKIAWIDAATFEHVNWEFYKDQSFVYWGYIRKIEWRDSATFMHVWWQYFKDKDSWYFWWKEIEWSDPSTIEFVHKYFAKDKNNVYYRWLIIEWVDADTFSHIWWFYFRMDHDVYYLDKLVWWPIRVQNGNALSMKDAPYTLPEILAWVNAWMFDVISDDLNIASDGTYTFWRGLSMDGIDSESLTQLAQTKDMYVDKNSLYYKNEKYWYIDASSILEWNIDDYKDFLTQIQSVYEMGYFALLSYKKYNGMDDRYSIHKIYLNQKYFWIIDEFTKNTLIDNRTKSTFKANMEYKKKKIDALETSVYWEKNKVLLSVILDYILSNIDVYFE